MYLCTSPPLHLLPFITIPHFTFARFNIFITFVVTACEANIHCEAGHRAPWWGVSRNTTPQSPSVPGTHAVVGGQVRVTETEKEDLTRPQAVLRGDGKIRAEDSVTTMDVTPRDKGQPCRLAMASGVPLGERDTAGVPWARTSQDEHLKTRSLSFSQHWLSKLRTRGGSWENREQLGGGRTSSDGQALAPEGGLSPSQGPWTLPGKS